MSAGSLLVVGFEGTVAPPEVLERIAQRRIGGVVLFARNLGTLDDVAALTASLYAAVPAGDPPLWVSLDQEGGRVQRIRAPLSVWPPMQRVAAVGDEAHSRAVGQALGAELLPLGFNVDYAPVLDVLTNPANPVIGDRAFGTDPVGATAHALAFWRGLEASGVRGCGKHFPGHGDTATDSHLELPHVDHDEARLRAVELEPFRLAIRAGMPMLMTAHVVYGAVDSRPATMSHRWLTEILRGELGFDGLILSDDLDMKAVAANFSVEQTVVDSLLAGCDAFLACRDPEIQARAEAALSSATDPHVRQRVLESSARVRAFRESLQRPMISSKVALDRVGEHTTLVKRAR